MLDVPEPEPELVAVPERELDEEPEVAETPDAREVAEPVVVDLRDPVPTTPVPAADVLLARAETPVLAKFVTGVTKVEFWPAGTLAAAVWEVTTAG